ncbi:MAG: IclR family transcriptional regulator domain-containing protein [Acidimicrobiales bacterium]
MQRPRTTRTAHATRDETDLGTSGSSRRGEFVQSLERGLAVIRAFGPDRTRLTLTEVGQATGLTRAAARRFLLTLVALGYVRSEGREFSLRPSVLELGYAYLSGLGLPEVAMPFMDELVSEIQETSSIAVLDGNEIVYVANVAPRRVMTINVSIGGREPAYCTSLGRVLLAARSDAEVEQYLETVKLVPFTRTTVTDMAKFRDALESIRRDGYSLIDGEYESGLVALAVPVRDAGGNVVAAMNVSGYSLRTTPATLEREFLPLLRATVDKIEFELRATNQLNGATG